MRRALVLLLSGVVCLSSSEPLVEQVTEPLNHVEGPHWDPDKQVLYYVDIVGQLVNKYDPKTGVRTQVKIEGGTISPVLTVQGSGDQFVVGRGRDLVTFTWDGEDGEAQNVRVLASIDQDKPANQFNDGKADSQGRIWAGTMENDADTNQASFFLFSKDNGFNPVKKLDATTSNGLAWNDNDTVMYYIDSPTQNVDAFIYDGPGGDMSQRQAVFNMAANGIDGVPDGMTIDSEGNLWVAVWGAGLVLHINPGSGHIMQRVPFPAKQVSSCTFGGPHLDVLYVTTSRVGLSDEQIQQQPLAGAVFAVRGTGARGQLKNTKVRLN